MQKGVKSYGSRSTLLVGVGREDLLSTLSNRHRDRDLLDVVLKRVESSLLLMRFIPMSMIWIFDAASCLHREIPSRRISLDPSPDRMLCIKWILIYFPKIWCVGRAIISCSVSIFLHMYQVTLSHFLNLPFTTIQ